MPKLIQCSRCGYTRSWIIRRHHRRCKSCRREWSPGTHFLVPGLRINRERWRSIGDTFLAHKTIKEVSIGCHLSYATAHKAVHLLRTVMTADVPTVFTDTCEVDETFIGGAWRNKAIHIRRQGSPRGRGTQKQPIFGVVCREQQQVRVWLVPNCKQRTLFPLIRKTVLSGTRIFTDGYKMYRRLPRYGYDHDWVDHDAGEYVRGEVHTQTIDGFWGLLKTHLDSIGGIRKRFAHLFVGEYVWRYNFRHLSRQEQGQRLLNLLAKFGGRS